MWFKKLNLEWKILVVLLSLFLLVLVVFLTLMPLSKWLWLGWLYGSFAGLVTYLISILFMRTLFLHPKGKTKFFGFMVGFGKTMIILVLHVVFCLILVVINNSYFAKSPFAGGVWVHIHGPIEIFTYLGGVALEMVVIVIAAVLDLKTREV